MVVSYGFFDSINGDRKYRAEDLNMIVHGLVTDGVYSNVGDKFKVTPVTGYNAVNVGTGRAWFANKWLHNDSRYRIDLEPSDPVNPRIDAITIQVHPTRRYCVLAKVDGVPAADPQRPEIKKDPQDYMGYPVAYIRRPAKATTVSAGDITYVVGTSECPFIASLQGTFDVDSYLQNFQNQFDQWLANQQIPPGGNPGSPNPDQGGGGSGSYPSGEWTSFLAARKGEWDTWFQTQKTDLPRNWNTWLEAKKSSCSREWTEFKTGKDVEWGNIVVSKGQDWNQFKQGKEQDWTTFKDQKSQEFQEWLSQQNSGSGGAVPSEPPADPGTSVAISLPTLYGLIDLAPSMKNSIFRGKALGETLTPEQGKAIRNGTFKDLFIGDYWEKEGVKWYIYDFNYYYSAGATTGYLIGFYRQNHIIVGTDIGVLGANKRHFNNENQSYEYHKSIICTQAVTPIAEHHRKIFGDHRRDVIRHEPVEINKDTGVIETLGYRNQLIVPPTVGQLIGAHVPKGYGAYDDRQFAIFNIRPDLISQSDWHQWTRTYAEKNKYYLVSPGNAAVTDSITKVHRFRAVGLVVGHN